jgi:hypothetical protein
VEEVKEKEVVGWVVEVGWVVGVREMEVEAEEMVEE